MISMFLRSISEIILWNSEREIKFSTKIMDLREEARVGVDRAENMPKSL